MPETYDGYNPDDTLQAHVDPSDTAIAEAEAEEHGIDMDDGNDEIPEVPEGDEIPDEEGELDVEGEEAENAFDAESHQITHNNISFLPVNQSSAMLRQAEERRQNDVNVLNGQGCFNLVGGIIRQQIEDYRKLEMAGVCKNGKVIVDKMPRKVNEGMSIAEAKQTCHFLQDYGAIQEWITLMGVNVSPAKIRQKGGLNW
jgi:hypothetical protein